MYRRGSLGAGDVQLLVKSFVGSDWSIESELVKLLEQDSCPGKVRQLQNAIEREGILALDDWLRVENMPLEIIRGIRNPQIAASGDKCDLETLDKAHIAETSRRHHGNKARTVRALGIGRRTLYRWPEKYAIEE